jgi:hypothetical protein
MFDRDALLLELARAFAQAAVEQLLAADLASESGDEQEAAVDVGS